MRIVFMGTPEFAVASLDLLIKNKMEVVAVVTVPDKPAGRGQLMHQSAVKKYALENGLKLLQPVKLKDAVFLNELRELKADLQIVVAFRMLPEVVWNMPQLGTYNLHASLLPKYRGAAPINWAIINGETETGVTTFKLVHEIDAGTILLQKKVPITTDMNAGQLHDLLMHVGADLLVETVKQIQASVHSGKELKFSPQQESLVCHAPKLFKETCKINWNDSSLKIYNLIRGLSPYPAAFTEFSNLKGEVLLMKIFEANYSLEPHTNTNGSLITDGKLFIKVYAQDGIIDITELQLQGKKRMKVQEFLRGFKFENGSRLVS
jgi:methionyl-tRNA formyltransferase